MTDEKRRAATLREAADRLAGVIWERRKENAERRGSVAHTDGIEYAHDELRRWADDIDPAVTSETMHHTGQSEKHG